MKPNNNRFEKITTPGRTDWAKYQRRHRLSSMFGSSIFCRPRVAILSAFVALVELIGYKKILVEHERLLTEKRDVVAEIHRLRRELNMQATDEEYFTENASTRMRIIDIVRWITK